MPPGAKRATALSQYLQAVAIVVFCTLVIHWLAQYFLPTNLIMLYLAGVIVAAVRFSLGPAVLTAVLSVSAFDFFFVPPLFNVSLFDTQYAITYVVMIIVAATISTLVERLREQAAAAIDREARTATLYALSRVFASEHGKDQILHTAAEHIGQVFSSDVAILLPDPSRAGALSVALGPADLPEAVRSRAQAAYQAALAAQPSDREAGKNGAGPAPAPESAGSLYLPLLSVRGVLGIVAVQPHAPVAPPTADQYALMQTFANQTAVALERAQFGEEADRARMEMETERTRNLLLSAVSHDLRTPLASITGAVSSLLENGDDLAPETRHELAQVAYEEADRLHQLLSNLLEVTRLQSGALQVHKEWQPVEEVVGMALAHAASRLHDRALSVDIPLDLPPVPLDGTLIEQVLVNLLDNAAKHTPAGSPVTLSAHATPEEVTIEVADRGPGIAPGDETRIFERFYQSGRPTAGGVGLGLAIAAGMVQAHGGRMWAENRPGGGAVFRLTLPRASLEPDGLPAAPPDDPTLPLAQDAP